MEPKLIYLVSALATIFPGMSGDEYVRLKDSIRNLGLLEDITMWRGMVVDGYHRLRACLELGIEPSFHHLPGDAIPLDYVAGKNASRRHMSTGQRAVVAFRASRLSAPGRPRETGENCANLRSYMTQGQAASLFGVSRRSVSSMARILGPESTAAPELRRAVLSGRVTASDANSVMGEPEDVQRRAVELVLRGECRTLRSAVHSTGGAPAGAVGDGEAGLVQHAAAGSGTVTLHAARRRDRENRQSAKAAGSGTVTLHAAPLAGLREIAEAESVDAIVTFPPANAASGPLLKDLALFAVHALGSAGGMFVLTGSENLPHFAEGLRHPDLRWVCALPYLHPGRPTRLRNHGVSLTHKLILVYGKPGFRLRGGTDVISIPPIAEGAGGDAHSQRLDLGMRLIIERFTQPGQVVCDPLLLGRGDSAVAAAGLGRRFVGAWDDREFIARLQTRLDGEDWN